MTSRMTATDELRRLLDERRVECRQTEWIDGITVKWRGSDGSEYGARNGLSFDGPTGGLVLYDLTPAQAVEATLGRGTCTVVSKLLIEGEYVPSSYYEFEMECGEGFKWDESIPPRCCPNCGRKVRA
ncbi:MAG: hypothetical protein IJF97_01475 [Eggerthellaceae bacterium]|nr:hypothetical protein [Eggerthellaceae bacterium]